MASASRELTSLTACAAVELLRTRQVSSVELVEAALARIEQTDPRLNALPTVCAERALARAAGISAELPLAGLPLVVKDLTDVAGVRTTYGSPIYADHVPERSDALVERIERRGGVVMAKSNTPEFGAGGNTYNEVFGETRNPWNTAFTCGGSSGGSAAALAAGQVWLATGSDLGGSLRTPAGFCSVVGLRPTPGRVGHGPSPLPFDTLAVEGPMARTVADAALLLDVMSGLEPLDPLSNEAPPRPFLESALAPRMPARLAYSDDLGITPVAAEVREVCGRAMAAIDAAGVAVEAAHPELAEAPETFHVLRAAGFAASLEPLYRSDRERLKDDIVWNVEQGLALSAERLAAAERERGALHRRVADFLAEHELLVCPSACVAPFDISTRWVHEVDGVVFGSYVEWLRITSALTLSGCPVIALPCGFTAAGLPVGLQLVGRPRGEAALLSAAAAIESLLGVAAMVPIEPRPA